MWWRIRREFQAEIDGLKREVAALRVALSEVSSKPPETSSTADREIIVRLLEANERLTGRWQEWYAREKEKAREQRREAGKVSAEKRKEKREEEQANLFVGDPNCKVCRGETATPLEVLTHLNAEHPNYRNGQAKA